jgi:hypothetical protein
MSFTWWCDEQELRNPKYAYFGESHLATTNMFKDVCSLGPITSYAPIFLQGPQDKRRSWPHPTRNSSEQRARTGVDATRLIISTRYSIQTSILNSLL